VRDKTAWEVFKSKLDQYANPTEAIRWFSENYNSIRELFTDQRLLEFVFEPIKDVFVVQGRSSDDEIRAAITRVAVANAVLAGLPGRMGVGIFVSIGLEAWMAYVIASRVGIQLHKPADIFKYFSLLAGIGVTILWAFKELLGLMFSLFSFLVPFNPLIAAELVVTDLIGVLFWVGFDAAKQDGSFKLPMRALTKITAETKGLATFQLGIIKKGFTPENWLMMGLRLKSWFKGEIPYDKPALRGELFATVAMAWLISGEVEKLQGPVGQEFLGAIRDRFPDLVNASELEISEYMADYDVSQIPGVINLIKGKLFERLEARYENADGNEWSAHLHEDETFPGSDITFENNETGELIEVSLKATDNPAYIEEALRRYPDIPIMTTEEVAEAFPGSEQVIPGHVSNSELETVTEDNFEDLLKQLNPVDAAEVAGSGPAVIAGVGLWPFVVAYLDKRISYEQLEEAFVRVMGDAGKSLAARVSYAVLLGPIFAWYLLARGTILVVKKGEEVEASVLRLSWSSSASGSVKVS